MGFKKALMTQIWRIQQSQAIISILFWALTLAGVFYVAYVHPWFVDIGVVREDQVLLGTLILFLLFLAAFLILGFVYDNIFQLWKEQNVVAIERNPYASGRLMPKEIVLWRLHIEVLRSVAKGNPQAEARLRIMEAWINGQLKADSELARGVAAIERSEGR